MHESPHKATAAYLGRIRWEYGLDTPFDAEESTLFDCDSQFDWNAYSQASHRHRCVLIDVDGKAPK
jgi:hypothetical protein